MTVRRYGLDGPGRATHQPLGHLVVTIDDLGALLDLLATADHSGSKAEVVFLGGTFDDPEDLRRLNDFELDSIIVRNQNITVTLGIREATASGDARLCGIIYNSWALPRSAKVRPKFSTMKRNLDTFEELRSLWLRLIAAIIPTLALLIIFRWNPHFLSDEETPQWAIFIAAIAIAFCWPIGALLLWLRDLPLPYSFAIISPISLEEARARKNDRNHYLLSTTVGLAGVVVAMVAILVSVLLSI
jgi:hypothetical protein